MKKQSLFTLVFAAVLLVSVIGVLAVIGNSEMPGLPRVMTAQAQSLAQDSPRTETRKEERGASQEEKEWTDKRHTNAAGMKFVLIKPGTFLMGSPVNEAERGEDEGPQRRVSLTDRFYLQTTEVTQNQWKTVMKTEPWKGDNFAREGGDYLQYAFHGTMRISS